MGLFIGKDAASGAKVVQGTRIVAAFVVFFLLLGIAIAADAYDWVDDPTVIYGFAELAFGVIVGWLGGEGFAS
jgi:hypothetical protein